MDCCTAFYEQDWVRELAGDHFHPGGAELTRRTASSLGLPPGARVLELGCGTGTTALLLAREFGFQVTAIDLSAANITLARARINGAAVRFDQADARCLTFPDASFDGVLAECAFSLFAGGGDALAGIRRVLRPGGAVALTDMAVGGALPDDLLECIAPWTCLQDARSQAGYEMLFESAGFTVLHSVDESAGLTRLLRQLKRKLLVLGAGALLADVLPPDLDLSVANYWLTRFGAEVDHGNIRYLRFLLR